jgi:hypothetical protein
LALGTLLQMHREGSPILTELEAIPPEPVNLDRNTAVQTVIEFVANRFVLHIKNHVTANEDYRDLTALALLRRADERILRQYWGAKQFVLRIQRLARRYALVSGNDLHHTVREILCRHWRRSPPPHLEDVAEDLSAAARSVQVRMNIQDPAYSDLELELLNICSWLGSDSFGKEAARAYSIISGEAQSEWQLAQIVSNDAVSDYLSPKVRQALSKPWRHDPNDMSSILQWLQGSGGQEWAERDMLCLDLTTAKLLVALDRHAEAAARCARAIRFFKVSVGATHLVNPQSPW